jgi:complex iron-sulfur molybdoenzyme family reductase subunit alpha
MSISRRDALKNLLAGGVGLVSSNALGKVQSVSNNLQARSEKPIIIDDPKVGNLGQSQKTQDMYRAEFASTFGNESDHGYAYHCVNCQGNCAWEVWSKDGRVTRENQSASYPPISANIPDFNPRGCNKGVQHSQIMYEEDRLLYPLKRVGLRGEGKWKRISWEQAITETAEKLYETMVDKGPAGNYIHIGAGVLTEGRAASIKRLGALLGAVRPYIASYVGDMFPGVSAVYGEANIGCTYDFIYTTNVAIFWGCNPNTSRIPDAHFLWEGKYNGSKIIVISPELNSTAIHADLWVPIKPGYDGHLALSILHVIYKKKLFNEKFLQEYTDLPLLVCEGTKEFVRWHDVDPKDPQFDQAGSEHLLKKIGKREAKDHEIFLARNKNNNLFTVMPGSEGSPLETLSLQDKGWNINPELTGAWSIRLKNGQKLKVTTVFQLLKVELEKYEPSQMQKLTGVHPEIVEQLAQEMILPKNTLVTMGFSLGKHFNGMLIQRAISALVAFSGRLGKRGGLNTENEWNITGLSGLSGFDGKYQHRFASGFVSEFVLGNNIKDYEQAFEEGDVQRATGFKKEDYRKEVQGLLKKSANDSGYTQGKPYWDTTKTFLLFADARFRRNKGSYKEAFLKQAEFLIYGDYRFSDFAQYADILLPCKSHYEVWDIRTNPGYHRYANIAYPAKGLKNVGEAKSEWEIATLLVKKIEELAQKKYKETNDIKVLHIEDKTHAKEGFRALEDLVKDFTVSGKLGTDKQAVEFMLEHVDQFKPNTLESIYKRGGFIVLNEKSGKSSPLYKDKPYNTFETQQFLAQPFDTLTGRLSFYVDHPIWIQVGANVPTVREPIRTKNYALTLMTPHARWSIHSTYKTSKILQRLQRGKPYVLMNPDVARARAIEDGDEIRMFNNLGETFLMAKISNAVPKDSLFMEHGWEPFMYKNKIGHNALIADMINLLELTDGWGHLKFGTNWDGNQHAYEGNVEIEKNKSSGKI